MEWTWGDLRITDETELVDLDKVCEMLAVSYWAADRDRRTVEASVRGSLCLSAFVGELQVGFLRAVTDRATFAWICDVVVDEAHRRGGIGKRLMETALSHPAIRDTNMGLATRDAHGLYERYGFVRREAMARTKNQTAPIGRSGL
ncbi:GNAT family N-acetyltransferase [Paenibacillus sp.]|uniref:GNAT family N-acetyltransferase n=1 Tax=Paenibacillus sp. TaxID=58172 RepID=UPI00281197CA|nr:GNAT family N-acetyltransferase [Paenibacillus sp.]